MGAINNCLLEEKQMLRITYLARMVVTLTVILTAHIYTAPVEAEQVATVSGADRYKAILNNNGTLDKYIPYFGSEVAVINFARIIGNNACAAVINTSMSPENVLQSVTGQYRSQLINKGMSLPEANFLTATAVGAGIEVDCPTHTNRASDANRPRTTGITIR